MIPDDIRRLYANDSALLESIATKVGDNLLSLCRSTGFAYAPRPTAVKTLESVAQKLESGRYARWADLDDLVACSVIVPTRASEKPVLEYLQANFQQVQLKSRASTKQNPTEFRFGATRFIGKLRSVLPEAESLARFSFEVQIRTAFEHAWSVATHALAYKSDQIDWRMDRLAAQLKASVEQLDMLVNAYEANAVFLEPQNYATVDEQSKILEQFRDLFRTFEIPEESEPFRWGQFAKNVHSLLRRSQWPNKPSLEQRSQVLVEECANELRRGGWSRSLSLYQFALGVLVERELATGFDQGFYTLVTNALEERFPRVSGIRDESRCLLEIRQQSGTQVPN